MSVIMSFKFIESLINLNFSWCVGVFLSNWQVSSWMALQCADRQDRMRICISGSVKRLGEPGNEANIPSTS